MLKITVVGDTVNPKTPGAADAVSVMVEVSARMVSFRERMLCGKKWNTANVVSEESLLSQVIEMVLLFWNTSDRSIGSAESLRARASRSDRCSPPPTPVLE